jgi:hypothetical protein
MYLSRLLFCKLVSVVLFLFLIIQSTSAQVDIVVEDFETNGDGGIRYTSSGAFSDQPTDCDFFFRTNAAGVFPSCFAVSPGSVQGTMFWASEDFNDASNPSANDSFAIVSLNPAVVTGYSSLEIRVFLAQGQNSEMQSGFNIRWMAALL